MEIVDDVEEVEICLVGYDKLVVLDVLVVDCVCDKEVVLSLIEDAAGFIAEEDDVA